MLNEAFATQDEDVDKFAADVINGGEIDGDEAWIVVWEQAIFDEPVEPIARTAVGEDRGTYLDPIPVLDRSRLPAKTFPTSLRRVVFAVFEPER
ncbi:hypothetical protein PI125_g23679 [Phytophthora idaei]|nr:hypothetical protein PI125_g23679 [Phytophthora idaei]